MLSLKRKTETVEIEGEDGTVRNYTIVELKGSGRDGYLTNLAARARTDGNGKTIRNFDGIQANLIQRCLLDPDGKQLTEKAIQEWPATLQQELFERCEKLSSLGKDAEAEAGNG